MVLDWPHMLASAAIILGALWLLDQTGALEGASRGRRILLQFLALLVPLLVLNAAWPYGQ
jgi:hypothetical protein